MQVNVDNQIKENNKKLEASISKTIIDNLKPKITAMHSHIVENDLIRIVQEQLEIKAQQEAVEKDENASEEEETHEKPEDPLESSKETDGEDTSKVEPEKKKTKNKKQQKNQNQKTKTIFVNLLRRKSPNLLPLHQFLRKPNSLKKMRFQILQRLTATKKPGPTKLERLESLPHLSLI